MNIIKVTCPKCGTTLTVNNTKGAFNKNLKCPVCNYMATASNYILEPEEMEMENEATVNTSDQEPVSVQSSTSILESEREPKSVIEQGESEELRPYQPIEEPKKQPVVEQPVNQSTAELKSNQNVQPDLNEESAEQTVNDEVTSEQSDSFDITDFFSKLDWTKIFLAVIIAVVIGFVIYCITVFFAGLLAPENSDLMILTSIEPSSLNVRGFKQLEKYNMLFLLPACLIAGLVISGITRKSNSQTHIFAVFASFIVFFVILCMGSDEYPNVPESTIDNWEGLTAGVICLCMYCSSALFRHLWAHDEE